MANLNEKLIDWLNNPEKRVSQIIDNQIIRPKNSKFDEEMRNLPFKHCYIVCCVIFNEREEVLMIQEAKRSCYEKWYLPAGKVEFNETLEEAVIRECKEEAGVDIRPTALVRMDADDHWFRFTFTAEIIGGKLKTLEEKDAESLQAKFIDRKEFNREYPLRVNENVNVLLVKETQDFPVIYLGKSVLESCEIPPKEVSLSTIGLLNVEFDREVRECVHGFLATTLYEVSLKKGKKDIKSGNKFEWKLISGSGRDSIINVVESKRLGLHVKLN